MNKDQQLQQDISDEQLILACLNDDKRSFDVLVKRYLNSIYSFVFRYVGGAQDAEDITQEVFVKAWRNIKKFNVRKGSFKTWIFTIAKNTSIDWLKKKRTIPLSTFERDKGNALTDSLIDTASLPDELVERKDMARILHLAMERLSLKHRMVLFLRYNDHFTFREIGKTLEESLNTVKSRHRRALVLLKNLLEEKS